MSKDYYNTLGVDKSANADEIKAAFRKKAHEHHPDKGGNAEKFKELNEAYQVLGNAEKRKQYDQFGSTFQNGQAGGGFNGAGGFSGFSGWQNGGAGFDFEDLGDMFGGFGDIFGFGGGQNRGRKQARGRDLEMTLAVDFMDAVFGTEKDLSFTKNATCSRCNASGAEPGAKVDNCQTCGGRGYVTRVQRTILGNIQAQTVCSSCDGEGKIYSQKCTQCGGTGVHKEAVKLKVRIPAGIADGESIRLSGQGEAGPKGAPAGDLYLRIRLNAHKKFKRDAYDIRTDEVISISQAILGDKIEVETVHGPVKLKIPEGTQSATIFKLKEKGINKLHGRGIGDQYVKITVKIPTGATKKQKELLGELGI
ncbi:molecular chaperone DnaJ [Candidatus Falkowbacteria bacterium CG1_02_37_21]|nr:MAG: molecular chaperone DnaJ [Candidatus Falkowbacteria bacterium CG1_02_37_21]